MKFNPSLIITKEAIDYINSAIEFHSKSDDVDYIASISLANMKNNKFLRSSIIVIGIYKISDIDTKDIITYQNLRFIYAVGEEENEILFKKTIDFDGNKLVYF